MNPHPFTAALAAEIVVVIAVVLLTAIFLDGHAVWVFQ